MKTLLFVVITLAVLAVIAVAMLAKKKATTSSPERDLRARRPLTPHEESMFNRLRTTFPNRVVLAQVSFSALLDTKQKATRNTFQQKTADFVLCDEALSVVAVIELDDKSHKGRAAADAARDDLLTSAGYRVVRYANIPEAARLLSDFAPQSVKTITARPERRERA